MHTLDAIKARLENAKKANQPLTPEDETSDVVHCPLCDGEGEVPAESWEYNNMAAGVQVYGIGKDLNVLREFVQHAPNDIQFLLQYIDTITAQR